MATRSPPEVSSTPAATVCSQRPRSGSLRGHIFTPALLQQSRPKARLPHTKPSTRERQWVLKGIKKREISLRKPCKIDMEETNVSSVFVFFFFVLEGKHLFSRSVRCSCCLSLQLVLCVQYLAMFSRQLVLNFPEVQHPKADSVLQPTSYQDPGERADLHLCLTGSAALYHPVQYFPPPQKLSTCSEAPTSLRCTTAASLDAPGPVPTRAACARHLQPVRALLNPDPATLAGGSCALQPPAAPHSARYSW